MSNKEMAILVLGGICLGYWTLRAKLDVERNREASAGRKDVARRKKPLVKLDPHLRKAKKQSRGRAK